MQLKWNWRLTASHYDTKHMKLLHVNSHEDTLCLVWCQMSLFTLNCKLTRHYASKVKQSNQLIFTGMDRSFEMNTCTSGAQYNLLHIVTFICLSLKPSFAWPPISKIPRYFLTRNRETFLDFACTLTSGLDLPGTACIPRILRGSERSWLGTRADDTDRPILSHSDQSRHCLQIPISPYRQI